MKDAIKSILGNAVSCAKEAGLPRQSAYDTFKADATAVECMQTLRIRQDCRIEVPVGKSETVVVDCCREPNCTETILHQKRGINLDCCVACHQKEENQKRADAARESNKEARLKPDSTVPDSYLTPEEKAARDKRKRQQLYRERQKNLFLTKQLANLKKTVRELKTVSLDGSDASRPTSTTENGTAQKQNETFVDEARFVAGGIAKDTKKFEAILSEHLIEMFEQAVTNEGKGSDYEFNPEDVKEHVKFLMEQIINLARDLNGKKKQCRY